MSQKHARGRKDNLDERALGGAGHDARSGASRQARRTLAFDEHSHDGVPEVHAGGSRSGRAAASRTGTQPVAQGRGHRNLPGPKHVPHREAEEPRAAAPSGGEADDEE